MSNIYTNSNFIEFCSNVFGDCYTTNSSENINVTCPLCKRKKGRYYSKKKLAIHSTEHMLHCWVCGYKSKNMLHLLKMFFPEQIDTYAKQFLNAENISIVRYKKKEKIDLPEGFQLLATMDPDDHVRIGAINYLKSRGVGQTNNLWYWKFGITKAPTRFSGRIIVPSYDSNGFLNYFTSRKFIDNPKMKRYENPEVVRENIIFNEINIDWSKELTITEGVFDAFKCNDNVTSLLGSELNTDHRLFEKIVINKTPVLLALDNDKTGKNKTIYIAKKFEEYDISVKLFPQNHLFEDIGDMPNKQFMELKKDAKIFSREHLILDKIHKLI